MAQPVTRHLVPLTASHVARLRARLKDAKELSDLARRANAKPSIWWEVYAEDVETLLATVESLTDSSPPQAAPL